MRKEGAEGQEGEGVRTPSSSSSSSSIILLLELVLALPVLLIAFGTSLLDALFDALLDDTDALPWFCSGRIAHNNPSIVSFRVFLRCCVFFVCER